MKIESFVDVIMPNYNKGDYIEEAVNSVISQEYKNWKLFIIDNCSTDNSISVLKKIEIGVRNVSFYGDLGFLYKSNLFLRSAMKDMNVSGMALLGHLQQLRL